MAADWTTPADLVTQVQRLWERGEILRASLTGEALFPKLLRLSRPSTQDSGSRFEEVRKWIAALKDGAEAHGYVVEFEEVAHRQLGRNEFPGRVLIQTEADALRMIAKTRAAERFRALREETIAAFPSLDAWIVDHPMKVVEHADRWAGHLAVLKWFVEHPRSGLYRRQLEIEGVDTKFIEDHRQLLTGLLEAVLPPAAVVGEPGSWFDTRFGLREKPSLVRFRLLDERDHIQGLSDLTIPTADLARLEFPLEDVIVTENEVNGLALLPRPRTMVVFGQGYALETLGQVRWLGAKRLLYWGDIDTHGFAMLDRFRAHFPAARSFLMDRETLLAHKLMWVAERTPSTEPLTRLTEPERALHRELLRGTHGERLRLEQERITFRWVREALLAL
ncbi:MAG: hypothetical protein IAE78_27895 [Myxococcus sp.]|nr:hypothetical protein [Myxococcus sp.]